MKFWDRRRTAWTHEPPSQWAEAMPNGARLAGRDACVCVMHVQRFGICLPTAPEKATALLLWPSLPYRLFRESCLFSSRPPKALLKQVSPFSVS